MKKTIIVSILLIGTVSVAFAHTKTPVAGRVWSNSSSSGNTALNTPTHMFNVQIRKSMEQINKDMRSGKLTKTQAQTAWVQVKVIRSQEFQFFKQNGNKELTSAQLTQLNQSLTQLSSSL